MHMLVVLLIWHLVELLVHGRLILDGLQYFFDFLIYHMDQPVSVFCVLLVFLEILRKQLHLINDFLLLRLHLLFRVWLALADQYFEVLRFLF